MPSGWDNYYVVFLSAFLALGIPLTLALISFLVSPRIQRKELRVPEPLLLKSRQANQVHLGKRINTRFFLAANAALVLLALSLAIVPTAVALKSAGDASESLKILIAIVSVAGFSALGLLYSSRKGDLGWLKTFDAHHGDAHRGSGRSEEP